MEFYGIGPDGDVISELLNALLAERFPAFRADQKLPGRPAEHSPREMIRLHLRVSALFKASGIDPTKKGSKKRLLSIYRDDLRREFPAFASQKEPGSEYNFLNRCRREHEAHLLRSDWMRQNFTRLASGSL